MGSFAGLVLAVSAGAALTVTGLATATASAGSAAGNAVGAPRQAQAAAHRLPDFGNPDGHASVPQAGAAVNTSHPNHVIGAGTAAGCTSAAVVKAVASGGVITFNCGPNPVTITMTATAKVVNTSHQVVLDGGGLVTLSGGGKRQILYMNTCDKKQKWTTSDCYNQQWPQLTVQNITLKDGNSKSGRPPVASSAAEAAVPCSPWVASSRWSIPGSSTTAATSPGRTSAAPRSARWPIP